MKKAWGSLAVVCVLVIGVYAYMVQSGAWESWSRNAADDYYNLLVQGFRIGQLNLKKEVPPGLAQLADPYDPTANAVYRPAPYGLLDLSYYQGRFYLYWGVTPALVLFWPFVALTGDYLFQNQAVAIFCAIGFLASVGLLRALWRRYFAEASVGVVVACALALGLATGLPIILARSKVYEVPVSCGYMLTMLALGAIWCALHEPERRCRWLAAASVAYGLAVGARPSLLFGAVILLVPVVHAWQERQRVWPLLVAAVIPIGLIGLGLMLYNVRRFDSPFEFGWHYQLSPVKQDSAQQFSLRYLWFNFRVYFLEPARWSSRFPFVRDITAPPLPSGYGSLQTPYGVLTNIPLVWLALAVPLTWRNRPGPTSAALRWFVTAVGLLFLMGALTVCTFFASSARYEVEFLPALVLLAAIGVLGLACATAPTSESGSGQAERLARRRAVCWGWGLLVGFSVAFNLLASVHYYAQGHYEVGTALLAMGRDQEAIDEYEQALRIMPEYGEPHNNLGVALDRLGRAPEAIGQYEQALRFNPDYAEAHYNLGSTLLEVGRFREAIEQFKEAVRLKPDDAEAHSNLGIALGRDGQAEEGIGQLRQALRLKSEYAEAHNNLGVALERAGKVQEAIEQFKEAVRLKPDDAEAHYNLGSALEQAGRLQDAIGQYEQALQIKPDFSGAQHALARLQTHQ
ncbi:MAG TPA: tetratricopeptide repeat protein [Verrucomicrobiae bacterium]|nr:tetratricopeptide repeat protein [Verrucomicrobiae bacterium]